MLRRVRRPVSVGGCRLPTGAEVAVMVGAANRDPARFPTPDAFHPHRSPNPHLAFGLGIHYCPGAALARLTVRIGLEVLRDAALDLELAPPPVQWRDHDPIVRGPKRLLVRQFMPR